jgi:protein PhnA
LKQNIVQIKTMMEVKDSNGTLLKEGDSVTLIKDLNVKGSSKALKRGTLVKNIRITSNHEEIEGRVEKVQMVLKTCFLKKA